MRIKYFIFCLFLSLGIVNAQYQNYMLKVPDVETKTYIGRDYVRLLPGYSFKASASSTMNAKISEGLTSTNVSSFLSAVGPNGTKNINLNVSTSINTNLAVGQIPISSSVNPSGAKCYNVPIEIVSGRQGFQPNISLSYNSQVGNGLLGMGWSIGGLSSIQSIGQNMYFDGVNSATGAYALDGKRLILTNEMVGNKGQWQKDFETVQGNTKVTAFTYNYIIQYFTVLYPNGNVGKFENKSGTSTPLCYPITSLTDINGNVIEYLYISDYLGFNSGISNETYYIDEIKYGKCGVKDHFAKIKFEYESRTDTIFELHSTKSCIYKNRLKTIKTQVNSELLRTYELTYTNYDFIVDNPSYPIDVSRLTKIGCSAGGLNLNPIKLYNGEKLTTNIDRKEVTLLGENFDLTKINVMSGKFDSNSQNAALLTYQKSEIYKNVDGVYEFEYPAEFKIKIFNNLTGTTASALTPIDAEDGFEGVYSANIDGDSNDEVVKINSYFTTCDNPFDDPFDTNEIFLFKVYKVIDNIIVLSNTKQCSFGRPSYEYTGEIPTGYLQFTTPRQHYFGNFSGNGKTEVLSIPFAKTSSRSNIDIFYNNNVYLVDITENTIQPQNCGTPFIVKGESDLVYTLDVDGDGQTEVLLVGSDHTHLYKYKIGEGFQDTGNWDLKSPEFSDRQIMFADLNEDGNIDIIRSPQAPAINGYNLAPTWASTGLRVQDNYMRCPKCNYVHVPISRNYSSQNGTITNPPKVIGLYQGKYVDYKINQPPAGVICQWPKKISDTMAETFCPGCQEHIVYSIVDWDGHHCWECDKTLFSDQCFTHGSSINWSTWKYPYGWGTTNFDWIYQYTDGKSIVLSKTLNSQVREGETKFSIHEAFGDAIPDLIIQKGDGTTEIHPYIPQYRMFMGYRLSNTFNLPPNYEFIDVDCGSGSSKMLALGSNKIISFTMPFNHTRNNLISLMENSLGIVEKTDYSQLFEGSNYTLGTSAQFPFTDYVSPMWIVSQNRTLCDSKIIGNTNYNYQGAILHNQGLGFLGFSSIVSADLMTNNVTKTEYDPYKLGAVTKQTRYVGGSTSYVSEATFEYHFTVADNKKMRLLPISKTIIDNLNGNALNVTYPLEVYDDYGNAGTVITDFGNGIKTTEVITYVNRLGGVDQAGTITKRLIGLPETREITTERNGKTSIKTEGNGYYQDGKLASKSEIFESGIGYHTNYTYDPTYRGNLLSETHYNDLALDYLTTSYTYWDDDQCSLKTKTDPFNRVTTYTYDFSKRLLADVKDFRNKIVTYGYDNWRRLNKITRPDGTITDINPSWNSGSDPRYLIKETNTSTGQPTVTKYTDAFGRETRTSIGGLDGFEVYTDKNYDNFGRLSTRSAPYKASENALLTNYSYDSYERLENVVASNGSFTNYSYSGNSVTVNKDGALTTTVTDPTGKIISSTDDGGTVNYIYRADGQIESINTAGVVTSFEYNDNFNRQTKLVDPSAGTIITTYDDANHAVTQTWNSGKQVTIVTNEYGQPISKTTPDFVTNYGYENGLPKSVTTNNGSSKVIDYDEFGRLWKLHEVANGKTYSEEYAYELGQLKSVTYAPLDFTVNYKYRNGYLYKLEDALGNRLREVNSVNSLSMETNVLFGNGLTTTTSYTPEGLWTNAQTTNLAGSSSPIQNMSFDFNRKNGTLNARSDMTRGLTENFTYGDLLRLKTYGIPTSPQAIAYKANGNIDTKTDVGTYNYSNAYTLSSVNTNSDLTNVLNVDYTILSRPTTISKTNGLTATFSYNDDYDRSCMQVKQNGVVTKSNYFLGGGRYEIETEGGVEKQRLYLDGSPYDASIVAEKTSAGTQLYYLHRDYLGSLTQISDNVGNLTAEYSYDAWGRMRNVTNWNVYSAGSLPNIKFGRGYTGHEHLNQFGVINMNARLYDPLLGRFLAPDAQVAAPEMSNAYNRYIYAYNNPLMFVDLNGETGDYPGGLTTPNSNPFGPWDPSYNPYSTSYNYGGSYNSGNNYQSGTYSGMGGNYGGNSAGGNWGGFIFSGLQYLFSSPSNKYQGRSSGTITVTPTPISISNLTLRKVASAGASTVYSGGKNRLWANNSSGQVSGSLFWNAKVGGCYTEQVEYKFYDADVRFIYDCIPYNSYFGGAINTQVSTYYAFKQYGLNSEAGKHLMHEFGHSLQNKYGGSLWYNLQVVPSSVLNINLPVNKANNYYLYNRTWSEVQANTMSYYYFNFPSFWDFNEYPVKSNYISEELKRKLYYHK